MIKSACFTGHRKITGDVNALKQRLNNLVEQGIINLELTYFYTGGAIGWDAIATQVVLKLRVN